MFCNNCGSKIKEGAKFCEYCGTDIVSRKVDIGEVTKVKETKENDSVEPVINNYYVQGEETDLVRRMKIISTKKKWVAFFLCLFLGVIGIHRFYVGKVWTGILWLLTFGLLGIGWLVDLITILCGNFSDSYGAKLKK